MKNTYLLTDDNGEVIGVTQDISIKNIEFMLKEHFLLTRCELTDTTKDILANAEINKTMCYDGTDEDEYDNSGIFSITKVAFY